MNSMFSTAIPAQKPIIEMFHLAMDEKILDYLLNIGTEYHTKKQLEEIYHHLYGGSKEDWNTYWNEIIEACMEEAVIPIEKDNHLEDALQMKA